MRWFFVRAAVVALALAGTTGAAKAGWTTSGSATFTDGASGTKGTVDYAVWQNSGSTTLLSELNTALGLTGANAYTATNNPFGASATTPATAYLYFYEVVNTGSPKLNTLTLGTPISQVADAGVAPSSAKNNVFSTTGGTPTFTSSTKASAWSFDGSASNTQVDYSASGSNLSSGSTTTLMILASNGAPTSETGLLNSPTGTSASGSVPVPTPEPGTIALMGLALPIFGWGYMRRLRQNRALATVAAQ
jgi:hypothetical protein